MLGSYMLFTFFLHLCLRQMYSSPLVLHSKNIRFGFNRPDYAAHEMIRNGLDIAGTGHAVTTASRLLYRHPSVPKFLNFQEYELQLVYRISRLEFFVVFLTVARASFQILSIHYS